MVALADMIVYACSLQGATNIFIYMTPSIMHHTFKHNNRGRRAKDMIIKSNLELTESRKGHYSTVLSGGMCACD